MLIKNLDQTLPVTGNTDFKRAAWVEYWSWVSKLIRRYNWTIGKARAKIHAKGVMPKFTTSPSKKTKAFWNVEDCVAAFMKQFPEWQEEEFNPDEIWDKERSTTDLGIPLQEDEKVDVKHLMGNSSFSWETILSCLSYGQRDNFPYDLLRYDRTDDVKELLNDPLYGVDAQLELNVYERSQKFHAEEKARLSQLPDNMKLVLNIIAQARPSNYTVYYPYPINQFHSIPDCVCVMADGAPIFRLQCLDPDKVTNFKLKELRKPWWDKNNYDFDFHKHNIKVGQKLDLKTLLEVLREGVSHINNRHR